jgi:UDP-N-acetylmuramoyl-L-alanyl-D-glutamate--2,6-diaminopimelate ligase
VSSLHPTVDGTTLAACAEVADGHLLGDGSVIVRGVTLDSRVVSPDDLYAALPGSNVHGASFAASAVTSGASAILTDEEGRALAAAAGLDVPLLVVTDPRAVLGTVAAHVYGTTSLPVRMIGVTGTNGKTTTAYLLSSALEALGRTVGLIGTVETRIGSERVQSVRTTPESSDLHRLLAVMSERSIDDCVMEVSSHALALHRVDAVCYDIVLFTNLSQDHLDFHGDMEGYFAAKASLFTPQRARRGVICVDDDWGARLARETAIECVTVGASRPAREPQPDYTIERMADPLAFVLTGPDGLRMRLRSALPGGFNLTNTAMAAVTLLALGHPADAVAASVLTDPDVPGRMETVTTDLEDAPLAIVDYAHTPDAVAAAVAALRTPTGGPLIVVIGAGGGRDVGKRPAMGQAAASADVVIVTDDNPRGEDAGEIRAAVAAGARAAGSAAVVEEVADRRAAIDRAVEIAVAQGPSAVIALVGKGHETGQEIEGVVHPFDDRVELRRAIERRIGGRP